MRYLTEPNMLDLELKDNAANSNLWNLNDSKGRKSPRITAAYCSLPRLLQRFRSFFGAAQLRLEPWLVGWNYHGVCHDIVICTLCTMCTLHGEVFRHSEVLK